MTIRSIPWPRILAEGGAIVVSILLAFGIQAWWEELQERAEERDMLVSVHAEFSENRQRLADGLDQHRRILDASVAVLGAAPSDCGEELVAALRVAILQWRTFNSIAGATRSLIDSGRLGIIRDTELRQRLAAWDGLVSDLSEDEARTLERRDALAEYVAVNVPSYDCPLLMSDDTFLSLLDLRRFEENEVFSNAAVAETIEEVLAATS
jgi:hypothetical protein